MPKFNKGERVRKNLWTGIWVVDNFNPETKMYHLVQTEHSQRIEYPEGNTILYRMADGHIERVKNVYELTLEYHIDLHEDEIKPLPDEKTFQAQMHLNIHDKELSVLRKIDSLVGSNSIPYSIDLEQFNDEEIEAIQNLMWKQYWFRIGDRSIYGLGEFLKQDDKSITIISPIKTILNIYRDYK